jgi:hypothetical protein
MDATQLIEKLGGTYAVAALTNVKPPSVSGWKEASRIPDDKLIRLAPVAEARGITTRKELFPNDWGDIWPEMLNSPDKTLGNLAGALGTVAAATESLHLQSPQRRRSDPSIAPVDLAAAVADPDLNKPFVEALKAGAVVGRRSTDKKRTKRARRPTAAQPRNQPGA